MWYSYLVSTVISLRLCPAENTFPSPLKTIVLTVLSSPALEMSSVIFFIMSRERAFLVLGLARVMYSTPSSLLTIVRGAELTHLLPSILLLSRLSETFFSRLTLLYCMLPMSILISLVEVNQANISLV